MKTMTLPESAYQPLDAEEKEWMDRESEFVPLPKPEFKKMKSLLKGAAKRSIAARKMISIKVRTEDLDIFRREAKDQGIPYQTLMNHILHQYATATTKAHSLRS